MFVISFEVFFPCGTEGWGTVVVVGGNELDCRFPIVFVGGGWYRCVVYDFGIL